MKIENSIGWCDKTANHVIGCNRVSPGCLHCYAEQSPPARVLRRRGIDTWGASGVRHPSESFEATARRLNRLCICDKCHEAAPLRRIGSLCEMSECSGIFRRIRLFGDSNSDWLDLRWQIERLASFLEVIRLTPNIDHLLLTKRPELFRRQVGETMKHNEDHGFPNASNAWMMDWVAGNAPANVWIGTSVEDQDRDDRIIDLLRIPAYKRFLSIEPILEDIDIQSALGENFGCGDATADPECDECGWLASKVDLVIVGGESGPNRREARGGTVEAIRSVADQCQAAGVPVWVKQDCHRLPGQQGRIPDSYWIRKEMPSI